MFLLCVSAVISISAQCIKGDCNNGKGVFTFKDGSKYEGNFQSNKFNGYGIMNFSNGDRYRGQWKNHGRNGKGELTFANGDQYIGEFQEDKFWGTGIYLYRSGDKYEGEWMNNVAHGKGKYTFSDKERYEGAFFKGVFSGFGAFYYNDGTLFIGNWANNKKQGEGKMHYKNGGKIHGIWENDELLKRLEPGDKVANSNPPKSNKVEIKEEIEEVFETETNWKDCTSAYCSDEVGQLIYADGSKWQGQFMNGQPEGSGTLYYSNGNKYEGEIKNHAPNGDGVMYFNNNKVVGATWTDGYPVKRKQLYEIKASNIESIVDRSDEIKIWAVIVGVSSYAHMPALKYTDDDAYQIYAFLKSPEGGALPNNQIKLLIDENATRENILSGMNEILLKADENDVVLMYYSGHGLPGLFLPIDFDGYRNGLQHKEVMEVFKNSKAKHKLCIADACHSGSLLASKSPFQQQLDEFYSAYDNTGGGTAFIMSSKSEEVSLETSGLRQGIFSHYLIRGLNGEADDNDNKIVTVSELFNFVSAGVKEYSQNKQQPTIAGSYDEEMPVSIVRQ